MNDYNYLCNKVVIMANVIVNSEAKIGKCVILNSSSVIEHENIIEDFVHISPNVSLAGNVTIDKFSHIGIGATLIQGVKVLQNCIIGAGSVVINDIDSDLKVVGVPRLIHSKSRDNRLISPPTNLIA